MEVNREGIASLRSEMKVFNTYEAVVAKRQLQEEPNVMYEGRNIHSSPVDGKLLCSYSEKLCKQRRLNGYAFCIRHVLEDKNSPFKQCQYVAKYNGQQCTNPIPLSEDRIYCNSHLQVLGLVPKKSRKKKVSESNETESERPPEILKVKLEPPSLPVRVSNFSSSFVPRKPKSKRILKRQDISVPAVEELRQNLARKRQREDIFLNYGIESSEESDDDWNKASVSPCQHVYLSADESEKQHEKTYYEEKECDSKVLTILRAARLARFQQQLQRELCQLNHSFKTQSALQQQSLSPVVLLKATHADMKDTVTVLKEQEKKRKARFAHRPGSRLSCSFEGDGTLCKKRSLPYTRFCKQHINNDPNQAVFHLCTAKFPGGLQCSVPVFDVSHERPLCQEHAKKKDKFLQSQEQPAPVLPSLKLPSPTPVKQVKKAQRRKQPHISKPSSNKANKTARKPSRKTVPKVIVKLPKPPLAADTNSRLDLLEPMDTNHADGFNLNDQLQGIQSPSSLSLSPCATDYAESNNHSSLSPKLNYQELDPEYIETQQRNGIILPTAEEAAEIQRVLAAANIPVGQSSHPPPSAAQLKEAVAKIAPLVGKDIAFGHNEMICMDDDESSQKELETFEHTDKTLPFLNSRKSNCKNSHAGNQNYTSSHSVENILSHNNMENGKDSEQDSSYHHLKQDPMFSQAAGIKANANHAEPSHISMSVDSILSTAATQRHWTGIATTGSYSSHMNSHGHTNAHHQTPPPFSPPTLSPHFSHQASLSSAFSFDRTSQAQQQIMSPGLSPLSPSAFLKQPHGRRSETDQHPSKDNDPFLMPVDRDSSLFGNFTQGTDNSLSDLRLR